MRTKYWYTFWSRKDKEKMTTHDNDVCEGGRQGSGEEEKLVTLDAGSSTGKEGESEGNGARREDSCRTHSSHLEAVDRGQSVEERESNPTPVHWELVEGVVKSPYIDYKEIIINERTPGLFPPPFVPCVHNSQTCLSLLHHHIRTQTISITSPK